MQTDLRPIPKHSLRFGEELTLEPNLTSLGRLGMRLYGTPFIGGYLRFLWLNYFLKKLTLRGKKPKTVLDAGCGSASYSIFLAKYFPLSSITGVDLNQSDISRARALASVLELNNLHFEQHDLTKTNSTKFDLIVCIDVLEHIKENTLVLKSLIDNLEANGTLLVHVPDIEWLDHAIFGHDKYENYREFERKEHIGKNLTLTNFTQVASQKGAVVLMHQYTFGFWGRLAWELNQLSMEKQVGSLLRSLIIPIAKAFCRFELLLSRSKWFSGLLGFGKKPGGLFVVIQKNCDQ
ncbi:MAG: class I SAM-dependent methyltransferase [Bacteriovoracia bacterium]